MSDPNERRRSLVENLVEDYRAGRATTRYTIDQIMEWRKIDTDAERNRCIAELKKECVCDDQHPGMCKPCRIANRIKGNEDRKFSGGVPQGHPVE
jgi:hypothetical protein